MILSVDIGNTNIGLGVFNGNQLLKKYSFPTPQRIVCRRGLKEIFTRFLLEDAIVCSVVPAATRAFSKEIRPYLIKKPILIGTDLIVPVKNRYRNPSQVGQDRLVNAFAAIRMYGSPAIIIDFGTAVTFDVVSKNKEYLGGMILPGLSISLDALAQRTALLPKITLEQPIEFIGKDTRSSMLSGIVYGFAALTDNLTQRISRKLGRTTTIIGTGGNISLIRKFCTSLQFIDQDLTLKGINLLYQNR